MGVLNRLLLIVNSLLLLVSSVFGISVALDVGWGRYIRVSEWLNRLYKSPDARWFVLVLSVALLIFSIWMFCFSIQRHKRYSGVDRLTEIGHIRISSKALEGMALFAAQRVKGIRNLSANVRHDENQSSIGIGLKLSVEGDTPIQTLSEQLQHSVKSYVEEVAGVDVRQISVYIVDTVQPDSKRIRVK
ncbi:alkaline shock response membrane anchor protein AmaP [Melghirimyces algeriensis]|uniref:Uncharacterized conserved protein YloU, alkaline shock protein (Asp23) family n=1 Tax=Melghirimyces algeriensis TaxID=910412 RepID=A0A521AZ18_9BACL|nr:alkaline shock response membrane anchor protein AmaP [Melghirimyces algeriensis]SMO40092.1 Uncharacterized conserved protein YloU, alkaline shock protein (Asp23) family [Melghirimyces algeriensis]